MKPGELKGTGEQPMTDFERNRAYARWLGIENRAERRAFKRQFRKSGKGFTKSPKCKRKQGRRK